MKKIIAIILVLVAFFCLTGFSFNKTIWDTNYKFDKAIISVPNGEIISCDVQSWTDYDDCDMVQVISTEGTIYYTHGSNVLLIGTK